MYALIIKRSHGMYGLVTIFEKANVSREKKVKHDLGRQTQTNKNPTNL